MKHHVKIGPLVTLVAAGIITALMIITGGQIGILGTILLLPALPVACFLERFSTPIKGDTHLSPWDYFTIIVVVIVSSLVWGLIAGLLSKYVFNQRKNAA